MTKSKTIFFIVFWALTKFTFAQFNADAGDDKIVCPGAGIIIGGSPTAIGGHPPYTYSWQPTTFLDNPNAANPTCTPTSNTGYTVTVTDDSGYVRTDVMAAIVHPLSNVSAGEDKAICVNTFAVIGSDSNPAGITYSWSPGSTLNDSTVSRPTAYPGVSSVSYTLTATAEGCPAKIDNVTVTVIPTPLINAGPDVVIKEGERAILHATGGYFYAWGNGPTLNYIYSESCDAEPKVTTTYYLYGTDETNTCPGYDDVTVFVEPSDEIVIYNTFTPNGDGNNDLWYIGNIYKFPDNILEVYNRYGKLVYRSSGYLNDWDGRVSGEEIPSGTYFYQLDLGNGNKKYHGTVTIVK
jgi:gliding motility-associated-like protein